eukprot:6353299-Ditylum_brightwellii.AAC.1
MVATAQKELNLYSGLAQATGGRVSLDKGKNSWYLIEIKWDKAGQWKRQKMEKGKLNVFGTILLLEYWAFRWPLMDPLYNKESSWRRAPKHGLTE